MTYSKTDCETKIIASIEFAEEEEFARIRLTDALVPSSVSLRDGAVFLMEGQGENRIQGWLIPPKNILNFQAKRISGVGRLILHYFRCGEHTEHFMGETPDLVVLDAFVRRANQMYLKPEAVNCTDNSAQGGHRTPRKNPPLVPGTVRDRFVSVVHKRNFRSIARFGFDAMTPLPPLDGKRILVIHDGNPRVQRVASLIQQDLRSMLDSKVVLDEGDSFSILAEEWLAVVFIVQTPKHDIPSRIVWEAARLSERRIPVFVVVNRKMREEIPVPTFIFKQGNADSEADCVSRVVSAIAAP